MSTSLEEHQRRPGFHFTSLGPRLEPPGPSVTSASVSPDGRLFPHLLALQGAGPSPLRTSPDPSSCPSPTAARPTGGAQLQTGLGAGFQAPTQFLPRIRQMPGPAICAGSLGGGGGGPSGPGLRLPTATAPALLPPKCCLAQPCPGQQENIALTLAPGGRGLWKP